MSTLIRYLKGLSMSQRSNIVDLLTRQLQAMWSGDKRAAKWVTNHSSEAIASLKDPLAFYIVEPCVTGRTLVSFTEVEEARDLAHRLRNEPFSFSHDDLGACAEKLSLDLLWQRSQDYGLANMALMGCLANFCLFETGWRVLNEVPRGGVRYGGLLFYTKKKFRGDGDVVCRPFGGRTAIPLSEDAVLSLCAEFVEMDARNHPEMRKRFPMNKFVRKHLK